MDGRSFSSCHLWDKLIHNTQVLKKIFFHHNLLQPLNIQVLIYDIKLFPSLIHLFLSIGAKVIFLLEVEGVLAFCYREYVKDRKTLFPPAIGVVQGQPTKFFVLHPYAIPFLSWLKKDKGFIVGVWTQAHRSKIQHILDFIEEKIGCKVFDYAFDRAFCTDIGPIKYHFFRTVYLKDLERLHSELFLLNLATWRSYYYRCFPLCYDSQQRQGRSCFLSKGVRCYERRIGSTIDFSPQLPS